MADIFNLTDIWNNIATSFRGIKLNVTDTNSAVDSKLIDLQVGGVSRFHVDKQGRLDVGAIDTDVQSDHIFRNSTGSNRGFRFLGNSMGFRFSYFGLTVYGSPLGFSADAEVNAAPDTALDRNAAGVLEINNGTAGDFRDLKLRSLNASGVISAIGGLQIGALSNPTFGSGAYGIDDFRAAQTRLFAWTNADRWDNGTQDTGLGRNAAGVVEINNGTAGTFAAARAAAFENAQGTLTSGTTIAWDVRAKQSAILTLATNATLSNPTNAVAGTTYMLVVKQDATGSRTLAYGTNYKWPGGAAPTLSTAANAVDVLTFLYDGTNMLGVAQKAFA